MSEARDNEWKRYYQAQCANWTPRDEVIAKNAFIAGWEARKAISMLGHVRPGYDPRTGEKISNKSPEPGS